MSVEQIYAELAKMGAKVDEIKARSPTEEQLKALLEGMKRLQEDMLQDTVVVKLPKLYLQIAYDAMSNLQVDLGSHAAEQFPEWAEQGYLDVLDKHLDKATDFVGNLIEPDDEEPKEKARFALKPEDIVDRLARALQIAVRNPEVRREIGFYPELEADGRDLVATFRTFDNTRRTVAKLGVFNMEVREN